MAGGVFDIGSVLGIRIQLHWTFVMLLLLAVFLGIDSFVFIVLLFAMVVLHELAHSVMAKRLNVKVSKIVLLPLGGASIIDVDNTSPDAAMKIAAVGPLMSIALGALFWLLSSLSTGAVASLFALLFALNVLLGVFNLFPAFPMDGGRVLRGFLERRHGRLAATKTAVRVSKAVLAAFVVGSVIYALAVAGSSLSEILLIVLWNFMLAVFVYEGADSELQSAYMDEYASDIKAGAAATKAFSVVKPTTTMREVYKVLLGKKVHALLFEQDGTVRMFAGLPPAGADFGESFLNRQVREFGAELPSISVAMPLPKAIERMRYEGTDYAVVLKGKKIAGLLSARHAEALAAIHIQKALSARKGNPPRAGR